MKKTRILLLLIAAIVCTSACTAGDTATTESTLSTAGSTAASQNTTIPTDTTATIPTDSTASIPTESTSATVESTIPTEIQIPTVEETTPTYGMPAPTESTAAPEKVNDTFAFDAKLSGTNEIPLGQIFSIEVTTTNISGKDYNYIGSSKIVGATVYLSLEVDGQVVTIQPDSIIIPKNIDHRIIASGEVITFNWTFSDYTDVVPGTYDLHFSFQGYKGILEDFVTIDQP